MTTRLHIAKIKYKMYLRYVNHLVDGMFEEREETKAFAQSIISNDNKGKKQDNRSIRVFKCTYFII